MGEKFYIGYAKEEWAERICEIWSLCFGDSITFCKFFFSYCSIEKQVMVLKTGEEIVSMLTIFPAYSTINGERKELAYLYAVATHPRYQSRGYSTQLLLYAGNRLKEQGIIPILVPASAKLADFYRRRGYYPATYRKISWIEARPCKEKILLQELGAKEYKYNRDIYYAQNGYVEWPINGITYRIQETRFFGGFAYKMIWGKEEYGILAYIQDHVLHIKEMISFNSKLPESESSYIVGTDLLPITSALACQLYCKAAKLVLPVNSNLAGEITLLSMSGEQLPFTDGYLNLVLD